MEKQRDKRNDTSRKERTYLRTIRRYLFLVFVLVIVASEVSGQSVMTATLMEKDQKTPEVSTEELIQIMANNSARVFDTRPFKEYAVSHIPGAVNVAAKPGVPISLYVSDITEMGRLLKGEKSSAIVLYCNGPFCGKSKRLAEELIGAGYTNVRCYQLGIPVWRALGGLTIVEPEGVRYVIGNDRTAVLIDARDPEEFRKGSVTNAKNLAASLLVPGKDVGEVKKAKDDGRLPMEDHNTRIIVFGKDVSQAEKVAQALAREAFHNVSYFSGTLEEFQRAVQ